MPITKSAKKADKQSEKKRAINLRRARTMKSITKEVEALVKDGKKAEAEKQMPKVQKAIDKALKKGVIKKNTAARRKSRISRLIKNSP